MHTITNAEHKLTEKDLVNTVTCSFIVDGAMVVGAIEGCAQRDSKFVLNCDRQ